MAIEGLEGISGMDKHTQGETIPQLEEWHYNWPPCGPSRKCLWRLTGCSFLGPPSGFLCVSSEYRSKFQQYPASPILSTGATKQLFKKLTLTYRTAVPGILHPEEDRATPWASSAKWRFQETGVQKIRCWLPHNISRMLLRPTRNVVRSLLISHLPMITVWHRGLLLKLYNARQDRCMV